MEIAKLIIDILTFLVLTGTLIAVIIYTRSTNKLQIESEKQTKAIIEQTGIGFQQTKAVIEQAKLIQRQMDLSVLPCFQMEIKEKNNGMLLTFLNVGKGVGLNIQVLMRFNNSDKKKTYFHIPILEPNKKDSSTTGSLFFKDIDSETSFIFNDLLGNPYIQVVKIQRLGKEEILFSNLGFTEPLTKERALKEIRDFNMNR